MTWQPTLLITDYEPSQRMRSLLRSSTSRHVSIHYEGVLLSLFGAKVVGCDKFDVSLATENVIQVALSPSSGSMPLLDDKQALQIAEDFQARLLQYRLSNYEKVRDSKFEVAGFKSPVREIAHCLGACLVDAPDMQASTIKALAEQDESLRLEHSTDPRAIVVEALLVLCHEQKPSAYVHEIAELANGILAGRHEILTFKPREVGTFLKALGLPTCRLGEAARGIQLFEGQRKRIHQLAEQFDVRSTGPADCSLCQLRKCGQRSAAPDAQDAQDAREEACP